MTTILRPATPEDNAALLAIGQASGLFEAAEMEAYAAILPVGADDGALWCLLEVDGHPVGAAMAEAEGFADRVWNLRFLALLPGFRRQGFGATLLRGAEAAVRDAGARMLLIDTAGSADFAGVRAFYAAQGYAAEARIEGYYGEGVDKVTFRKTM